MAESRRIPAWSLDVACARDRGAGGGFIAPEATGQTFHPRRDRREESRQPPGQVPWHTFCGASSVLVSVWLVGIGWYVLNPLAMNNRSHVALVGAPLAAPRRVPLQPMAVACHDGHGAVLLAERFAVHQALRMRIGPRLAPVLNRFHFRTVRKQAPSTCCELR